MLDSSTDSPSAGPLRKLIDHHRWSLDCFSLSRLSASYLFVLLVGRFAFAPCASGFCAKPALSKGFVLLPVLVGRLFLSSLCPPILVLLLRQRPVCCVELISAAPSPSSFHQPVPLSPLSVQKSLVLLRCILLCFVLVFCSCFTSSLFVYILASSFSTGRTRLCFSAQRDMQSLFSR